MYVERHRKFQEAFSQETVHELRVASRRLMAQCDLLKSVVPNAAVDKVRRILKRRLKTLGELRDIQVQRIFVEERMTEFPELILVRDYLERRERRLAKNVAGKLKGFNLAKLERWMLAVLLHIAEQNSSPAERDRLSSAVLGVAQDAYAEVVRRRHAINFQNPSTIHSTRVRFKKFRYVIEALSPDITGYDQQHLRALANYQRKMGEVQDMEVMQDCLSRFIRKHSSARELFQPFSKYLQQHRTRAVWSFAQCADKLFEFWPAAWHDPGNDFPRAQSIA